MMMTTTTDRRPTRLAPPGATCSACGCACQGEPVTTYATPVGDLYAHADEARCLAQWVARLEGEEGEQ